MATLYGHMGIRKILAEASRGDLAANMIKLRNFGIFNIDRNMAKWLG